MLEREAAGIASAPLDANWLYAATTLGVLAALLDDAPAAAAIYPHLLPYGHRTVMAGRASYCTGSASLPLGLLAITLGDRPAAVAHLEEAVRRNDAFGAVPYAAAARQALAGLVEDPRAAPRPCRTQSPGTSDTPARRTHGGVTVALRKLGMVAAMSIFTAPATSLAERLTGQVITPDHLSYEIARRVWNGMIDKRPAMIARCADADDVATAIRFAAEHGLPLAVRGGGHNVAGTAASTTAS